MCRGSGQYAVIKDKGTEGQVEGTDGRALVWKVIFLLWVDGILDDDRRSQLLAEPHLVELIQKDTYSIAIFSSPLRWPRYLDPHRWITQVNVDCSIVDINFNPTDGEVNVLREWVSRLNKTKRIT